MSKIIKSHKNNEDVKVYVNKAGVITQALEVDGATGAVTAPDGFVGNLTGNASTVTNGVYTTGAQSIAGVKTFTDGIIAANTVGTHNFVINGNFDFWQRNTTFTPTTTPGYTADRWYSRDLGSGSVATVAVDTAETDVYGQQALKWTLTTMNSGTSLMTLIQPIETKNSLLLVGKSATLSFLMKRNASFNSGTILALIRYTTTVDDSPANIALGSNTAIVTITPAMLSTSEYTRITATGTVSATAKTLGVVFITQTAPSGSIFHIKQVKVNEGSYASPFTLAGGDIAGELAKCYRYYKKSYEVDTAPGTATINGVIHGALAYSTSRIGVTLAWDIPMRVAPTVVLYSRDGTAAKISTSGANDVGTTVTALSISTKGIPVLGDSGSGFTAGSVYQFHYTATAEL